jgi:PIN domain nuclease of toxin-antitoxin system
VLDASAMIAYLRGEPGADRVESAFSGNSGPPCIAHAINLCEVYYKFMRASGEDDARSAIRDLKSVGLTLTDLLDEPFWRDVGRYKATLNSLPLADCFVVALANRLDTDVMTADHPDFDPIAEQGICRVTFIR